MGTIFLWLGVIVFIALTALCAAAAMFAAVFSGWSLYGGSSRNPADWWVPIILAVVFGVLALLCVNGLSAHPLVITVQAHASTR